MTHILLLFIDMSNLEPNVGMREGAGWIAKNTIEAGKGIFVLALLFVYDTKSKENFVGLVEI